MKLRLKLAVLGLAILTVSPARAQTVGATPYIDPAWSASGVVNFNPPPSVTAGLWVACNPNGTYVGYNSKGTPVTFPQFNWYRSGTHGGPYTLLNATPQPSTVYIDTTWSGTEYYVCTVVVNGVESAYSPEVSWPSGPVLNPPTDLTAVSQ